MISTCVLLQPLPVCRYTCSTHSHSHSHTLTFTFTHTHIHIHTHSHIHTHHLITITNAHKHHSTNTHINTIVCWQEQLLAELLANPVPGPPAPEAAADLRGSAVPPHVLDGSEITISDLMVGADPSKDQHLTKWLDAREKMGFDKMSDTKATGSVEIDEKAIRTLAKKYASGDKDQCKCRGNAITRSCAFTGSFVILECGRRILYPMCPGVCVLLHGYIM